MAMDIDTKQMVVSYYNDIIDIKTDIQVIMQLLVRKGIVTAEEVKGMRETVKANSPTITAMVSAYNELESSVNQQVHDIELYKKNIQGSLTESEKVEMEALLKDRNRFAMVLQNAKNSF